MTNLITTHILLTVTHDKPIAGLTDHAAGRIFMYDHVVDATARLCHIDAIEEVDELPLDMILHCPVCHTQHIDAPHLGIDTTADWTNPPHRSHLCADCGCVWRPADVPTNGVAKIKTQGRADSHKTIAAFNDPAPAWNTSPEMLMATARGMVFDDSEIVVVKTSAMGKTEALEQRLLNETQTTEVIEHVRELEFRDQKQLQRFIAHVKGERAVMITLL